MTTPGSGALRLARAAGFGLCAFALSVAAHVAGGGQLPSAVASIVLVAACCWASVFLTWRRLGARAAALSMGVMQLLLHGALMVATSAGAACPAPMPAHAHHMGTGVAMMPACHASATATAAAGAPTVAMAMAHVAAAVLLGLLLSRVDRAVWFLASLRWWAMPTGQPVCPSVATPRVLPTLPSLVRRRLASGTVCRRGPPFSTAPALA